MLLKTLSLSLDQESLASGYKVVLEPSFKKFMGAMTIIIFKYQINHAR